ncbi:MAG: DEAD/DEAH box helicase family protein, partial [Deltaproteobacteria bacterium]|nr:DEAD/DEAH box helicase family protein [Deltaproteobacteria bacterium]
MHGGEGKFAQVVIPSPLKEPLTYAIPPLLQDGLKTGMRVLVPLGKRKVTGVVVDFLSETPLKQVREILALLDERPILDTSLLKLSQWVSQYYLSPVGEVMATILPPSLRVETQRIILPRPGEFPVAGGLEGKILTEVRKKKGRMTIKTLARRFPGGGLYQALNRLASMGAVEVRERLTQQRTKKREAIPRDKDRPLEDTERFSLTPEQQRALHVIRERLERGGFETFLLYGVTGSGKTEVYIRAMEQVRTAQRRSLILIPEISLTP